MLGGDGMLYSFCRILMHLLNFLLIPSFPKTGMSMCCEKLIPSMMIQTLNMKFSLIDVPSHSEYLDTLKKITNKSLCSVVLILFARGNGANYANRH